MRTTQKRSHSDERRRKDLAMIHIARKQLNFDDAKYRGMLIELAGVDSAADLDQAGRDRVLAYLRGRGFKPAHRSAKASGMQFKPAEDRAPYLAKIGNLLSDLGLPWSYVDGMAKKMFGVNFVRWLKPGQLQKVMVALIYYQKRKEK